MGNERKLRLIQVAKEFKVGLNTVTDFLQKKEISQTVVLRLHYAVQGLEHQFVAGFIKG